MPTYYTVIQYLPDPVTEERINIGVVVFGGGIVKSRFLRTWQRVRSFGSSDIRFLQEFVRRFEEAPPPLLAALQPVPTSGAVGEEFLNKIAGRWINSIQFTPSKASLKEPNELLPEVASRYLRETQPRRRALRDKRVAVNLAVRAVKLALKEWGGVPAVGFAKKNSLLQGKLDEHRFDLTVSNGRPFFAAQGLSFEVPDNQDLRRDIDATAWAIDDVKSGLPDLPLAVVTLLPKTESKAHARAVHIFEALGANVVDEEKLDDWASRMASAIPAAARTGIPRHLR